MTGICACNTGWEAFDCSQDVNECKEKIIECDTSLYQVCVNIPGSAKCECRFGGLNITDCNRKYLFIYFFMIFYKLLLTHMKNYYEVLISKVISINTDPKPPHRTSKNNIYYYYI